MISLAVYRQMAWRGAKTDVAESVLVGRLEDAADMIKLEVGFEGAVEVMEIEVGAVAEDPILYNSMVDMLIYMIYIMSNEEHEFDYPHCFIISIIYSLT